MVKNNTSAKGNLSELKVMTAYMEAGFIVSVPFGGGAPYDLIVDTGERLMKVQVKTGRLHKGCILFPTVRFSGHSGKGLKYAPGEIDLFAVYCPEANQIYVWPFGDIPAIGSLRRSQPKNNQKEKIRWAKSYEFQGHLEELREKVELRGIEPLTS
jgi:hypothetical protein